MSEATERLPDGMLILDQPASLPEVWDILVVGGGPAGTAAAFRAKEQGLVALVIDYDDLMKRIRDYAKDKPILPSFGGGDQMAFPSGGDLVSKLCFDPIQKDEMCRTWKNLYRDFNVPAKLGIELLGMALTPDQVWEAAVWNHNTEARESLLAKHVVFAIGRGVPRNFDIPGNTEGITRRLSDSALYASGPACVIGGGTSAAEAVISISNAKKRAGDEADVYWSYRGDRMPKVSKALSDVFFEAYVGNGNIRYLPHSEPVAVMTDSENEDFLCIRTDRKVLASRPVETVHLEFPKRSCIACIGEDLPEPLLNSIGIFRTSGGPHNRQRFVVSPLLETALANLYLAGDLLSPAYLETENFDADPTTFREVKRRGNIKSALRDGVFVTEVIAQKLAGETRIHVQLEAADKLIPRAEAKPRPKDTGGTPPARLVRILDAEVSAEEFPLPQNGVATIGRSGCDISFPEDTDISHKHASIDHRREGYFLTDEGGAGGVFIRPREGRPVEVAVGAILKAGQQWLVFEAHAERPELVHYDAEGWEAHRVRLSGGTIVVGRDAPDLTLDRSDPTLSRRHLSISLKRNRLTFTDLRSTNGTLLKVTGPTQIWDGDRIIVGHQVLQFVGIQESMPQAEIKFNLAGEASPVAQREPAQAGGPSVTFGQAGECVPLRKGQTICELAEERGISITAQCHQGICGSDPIRILSGNENLNPRGEAEEETLEELCSVEGDEYRLACLARPSGPVTVEILQEK